MKDRLAGVARAAGRLPWPVRVVPRPARQLAAETARSSPISTAALGFLDATDEDRLRWASGFRALLDGLDSSLQVVIDSSPGVAGPAGDPQQGQAVPPAEERRAADLAFATSLRRSPEAQARLVRLVVDSTSVEGLRRALGGMGVRVEEELAGDDRDLALHGRELRQALHDGNGWHRTWFIDRFPGSELEAGWLLRLIPPGLHLSLSWHAERLSTSWVVHYLQRQLVNMRAARSEQPDGVGDPALRGAMPAAEQLQEQLIASQESAFYTSVYLTVTVDEREDLVLASRRIQAAARASLCSLVACDFRQLDGRLCTLPLGQDVLARKRLLHSSSLTTLFPWFDADLYEPDGLVLGRSRATGQPVMVDPFDDRRYANANIGVFGHSGAGKTYLMSVLLVSALNTGAQIFVIDPEHEYGTLAEMLGGVDIPLNLGSHHSLNVLEMRGGQTGDEATLGPAVADTVDLCATICGSLDEAERAVLEQAIRQTFQTVSDPVLGDVAALLEPNSRAGKVLGRWVQGSLGQIFSRPTNVDLEAPVIVFGMRELRQEMIAPVHYLLAEALWARIKKRDRRRLLVIDELGLLFEDATIRQFVVALARRIRKYHGSLVFATQNPGDLFSSEAGRVVATNPALMFFGAQRPAEAQKIQAAFSLSEAQRSTLETCRRGEFLLAAGPHRLPLAVQAPPWQAAAMAAARAGPPLA
ncbi:MAG: DUF87 domain-containing protein [Candidatus Dormibacteraeota bacterium]|uniref:DUF87 domain-containing protein n=1 Tax=Candidatus Dormiibacter inghamiae TaxID=3127013 RepID=A0A934KJR3_9BACT|nr:DUF87 domain-containing protein [Candidatus Dormibacteraeota bacterium]MBJ7606517.1 DUF87 domain-containing protein [Candidatus Dormibacteraeota bacterium]